MTPTTSKSTPDAGALLRAAQEAEQAFWDLVREGEAVRGALELFRAGAEGVADELLPELMREYPDLRPLDFVVLCVEASTRLAGIVRRAEVQALVVAQFRVDAEDAAGGVTRSGVGEMTQSVPGAMWTNCGESPHPSGSGCRESLHPEGSESRS